MISSTFADKIVHEKCSHLIDQIDEDYGYIKEDNVYRFGLENGNLLDINEDGTYNITKFGGNSNG